MTARSPEKLIEQRDELYNALSDLYRCPALLPLRAEAAGYLPDRDRGSFLALRRALKILREIEMEYGS